MTWTIWQRGDALGAALAAFSPLVDLAATLAPSRWDAVRIEDEDRILKMRRERRCRGSYLLLFVFLK